jgi:hypothetical protein
VTAVEELPDRDARHANHCDPSPASPAANRGWAQAAERDLAGLGLSLGVE